MSLLAHPMLDKCLGTSAGDVLLSPAPGLGKWQGGFCACWRCLGSLGVASTAPAAFGLLANL